MRISIIASSAVAFAAAASLVACGGGRQQTGTDAGTDAGSTGCVGICTPDAGATTIPTPATTTPAAMVA